MLYLDFLCFGPCVDGSRPDLTEMLVHRGFYTGVQPFVLVFRGISFDLCPLSFPGNQDDFDDDDLE
jgi:hypothetical protein